MNTREFDTPFERDEWWREYDDGPQIEIERQRMQDKIFGADFPTAIKMFHKPNKEAIDFALKMLKL